MARFDVYPTPIGSEREHTPYWLDVQAEHLQGLGTRVVVPLRLLLPSEPVKQRLNPEFMVGRQRVYADTANIGAYPLALLRCPIDNLKSDRLAIDDALDFLFTGF